MTAIESATERFEFTSSFHGILVHAKVEQLCAKVLDLAETLVNSKEFIKLLEGVLRTHMRNPRFRRLSRI